MLSHAWCRDRDSRRQKRRPTESQARPSAAWGWAAVCLSAASLLGCERRALSDGLPDTMDCSSCHGSQKNNAPPKSVDGSARVSDIGVGAHQAHLVGGKVAQPILCSECHVVPFDMTTHPDPNGGSAKVVFAGRATLLGAQPVWDRTTLRCSGSYCHGGTLSGAESRDPPEWTTVDGSNLDCGACHGNPPGGTHPQQTNCEACHVDVGPGGVITDLNLHINGVIESGHPDGYADGTVHGPDAKQGKSDCRTCHGAELEGVDDKPSCDSCHPAGWRTNCTFCHGGTDSTNGAPPVDLLGNTETSFLGVGAHTEHLSRTTHPAYPCTTCHIGITDVLTPGHMFDSTPGRAEVVLSGLSPQGQYTAPICNNIYCHGNGRANGAVASFIPAAPLTCDSCHPTGGLGGHHSTHNGFSCIICHSAVAEDKETIANPDLHVNGKKDVSLNQGSYDATAKRCSGTGTGCHEGDSNPW
jgi:predicted CxxxxCH...CXXCH cytochrome family protein